MNVASVLIVFAVLFVFLLLSWCFVITKFQAKRRGILGYPARLVFLCLDVLHLADEWLREYTDNLREAIDLPIGKYTIVSSEETQIIQGHTVYDFKAKVVGNGKDWTVVSQRLPIQIASLSQSVPLKTFSVVGEHGRKRIVAA